MDSFEGSCDLRWNPTPRVYFAPLRILLVAGAFRCIGGVQENVDHLAAEFVRRNHTVGVLTDFHKRDSPERAPLAQAELISAHIPTQSPVTWRHLERLVKRSRNLTRAEEELADRIRGWRPDVVNCHEWHWDRFGVIARACRRAGVPLIFTLYDSCGRGKLGNRPLRWLESAIAVNAISFSSRSAIQKFLRVPDEMPVIYPGVDTEAAAASVAYRWHRPYIFSAGRLDLAHKAFDLLISSFAMLASSYPSIDLLIAGDGPDRAELEGLIAQSGLTGRVRLLGAVSRRDLWSLHKGSVFFAMPSRMSEGLGMVFLEAMAAAKAVIGTAIGGVSEIVSHDRTGVLLEKNDPNLVASALRRLLDDPRSTERMGRNGREAVVARHAWPQAADRYLALYDAHRARASIASDRIRAHAEAGFAGRIRDIPNLIRG